MGYVVLHIEKGQGGDDKMSSHIERKSHPANADETRTHLNKELIDFPEGVENRTQAIQHRIDNAGITRKVGTNQVRAIRIMLSGTPEDMQRIQKSGKLDDWCKDNIDWLRETYGNDNLVSAVLHQDETTPHIHATVVPIVTGERRKLKDKKQADDPTKKQYKKKNRNAPRLCVDDVMAKDKLKSYQDSYAEKMLIYGLQRGIKGSEARHIGTQQYYRDIFEKKEVLQEHVDSLHQEKVVAEEKVHDMYNIRDEAREKFINIDDLLKQKNKELSIVETKLEQIKQSFEPFKVKEELNQIHELFPMIKEQLRIADLAKKIGLGIDNIRTLFEGKNLTAKSYAFFSPEHNRKFEAKEIKLKIEKEPDNPNKLRLNLNGFNILDWFKLKYKEIQESLRAKVQPNINKSRGFRM